MKKPRIAGVLGGAALALGLGLGLGLSGPGPAWARQGAASATQTPAAAAPPGGETREAIEAEYRNGLIELERTRLNRLAALAAKQPKDQAEATYEDYLRYAIGGSLFKDAEPVAEQLIKSGSASPVVAYLASSVNLLAEVERGAYEDSLKSLQQAIAAAQEKPGNAAAVASAALPLPMRLALLEIYYQRLVQADQFEIARKAFQLIEQEAAAPAIRSYVTSRLSRLDMIGKAAPAIDGKDVDGKPFHLSDLKGNVVLVTFWASWCLPNAQEIAWFNQVRASHQDQGFRVVGVNLDTLQDGGLDVATVMPNVRRFLIDNNVSWPNLINGPGEADYAKAYGVTEIPANFLIDRKGTIVHVDLTRSNLETVVARTLGQK